MNHRSITPLPLLFLCLTSTTAYIYDPPPDLDYLKQTSDCCKDLPPGSPLKFHLYPATYEELIKRNDFFIDKTLLLKEVFAENASFLTAFYLPRKFCKSTNLQMIKFFAETKLDSNNSPVPANTTLAYDFFTRGKLIDEDRFVDLLKKPPLISSDSDFIDQHLGQYPVIYLNFSSVDASDFINAWNRLKDRIGVEFARYSFLADRIHTNESIRFSKLIEYFGRMHLIDDRERHVDLPSSIECLAGLVREFYGKRPILMIDEYDSVLDSFLYNRYATKTEDEKVLRFFDLFVRIFECNNTWHRVILTGTYSVYYNASLGPLSVSKTMHHALGNNISYFFGFTSTEIEALAENFGMTDDQLQKAKDKYQGYKMGPHYPIYNPWSILKYFQSKQLENHWEQTLHSIEFLKSVFIIDKMRNYWIGLLGDRTRCVTHIFQCFNERDFWSVKEALTVRVRMYSLSPKKFTQMLMYLADCGHLTWMYYFKDPDPRRMFNVWLPNEDTRWSTFQRLKTAFTDRLDVKTWLADEAASKLSAYLLSNRPGELFLDVMRSFQHLYNSSGVLFEKNPRFRGPQPKAVVRHIADYIGLRMRYYHEYKLDPMFMSGFLLRKSNVSYVVSFNYNESLESGDVLNKLKNYTHPWTVFKLDTAVKYVVISLTNDSDPHMLSYTSIWPADYSPPTSSTSAGVAFNNVSSEAGIADAVTVKLSTAFTEIIAVGNGTQLASSLEPFNGTENHMKNLKTEPGGGQAEV